MTGFLEAVRRANAPKPPEHSVRLRVASAATVVVAVGAAAAESELSGPTAVLAVALIVTGMAFSYRYRRRSLGWVKVGVALAASLAMVWFIHRLAGITPGDMTGVENPLTVMLTAVLVVHSFHVPARRDLLFAVAGSAALMAVAGSQAVDMRFGSYTLGWALCGLWALVELGASADGASRPAPRRTVGAVAGVGVVAITLVLVLPAPRAALRLDFRYSPGPGGTVPGTGTRAGDTGSPLELSHPGSTQNGTRVGGYLGFAGSLDTAARARLGRTVVMQVRAAVPTFWIGETFDRWDGQTWSSTRTSTLTLSGGSPFSIPGGTSEVSGPAQPDLQTFYVADATANLVFHADGARQVWFPASKLFVGQDGSVVSPIGIGKGAIYTVESAVNLPSPAQLRAAGPPPTGSLGTYLQLPKPYDSVRQLARSVTTGASTEYDTVQALISWIGAHTRYSLDIPPLPRGTDAVDAFLFGDRTGYCEQISTALAVMLRSLGIPAREAVGYVPGPYNPITDLYQVRAEDAHAWVQAYFAGYGWVSFDPTAVVPDANPSPGATALHLAGRWLAALPWVPLGAAAAGAGGMTLLVRVGRERRARRRLDPAQRAAQRMERAGRRAGRPRGPSETVTEFAAALGQDWPAVAGAIQACAYGGVHLSRAEWAALVGAAERAGSDRRAGGAGRRGRRPGLVVSYRRPVRDRGC
ncbi:MAG: transglutaminase domain-containing protein [Acidobacteriota bacterium]|nr:transglutaminase domain-containing protein [Acidobacteriota bacterium]